MLTYRYKKSSTITQLWFYDQVGRNRIEPLQTGKKQVVEWTPGLRAAIKSAKKQKRNAPARLISSQTITDRLILQMDLKATNST